MSITVKKYHSNLATYFQSKPLYLDGEGFKKPNVRKLVELPWQFLKINEWTKLEELFINIFFLEAKAEAGMVFNLVREFRELNENLPDDQPLQKILALLEEAIQRDIDFISNYPQTVFQCLWNSCLWHDCPKSINIVSNEPNLSSHIHSLNFHGLKLFELMEHWLQLKNKSARKFTWLRSLRPPNLVLNTGIKETFQYPGGLVGAIRFSLSANNKFVVAGYMDGSVGIWEFTERKPFLCLGKHDGFVMSVAISPDCSKAISSSFDGEVKIWDLTTQVEILNINRGRPTSCVDFSPDGKCFVCAGWDNTITIHYTISGSTIKSFKGHGALICSVKFSLDGHFIISSSNDYSIRKWDILKGTEILCIDELDDIVNCIDISPCSKLLVTGDKDGIIKSYDLDNFKQLSELKGHENEVRSVQFSPDSKLIVSGSYDYTIKIWDSSTGNQIKSIDIHNAPIENVYFLSDSNYLISGSNDSKLLIWNKDQIENRKITNLVGPVDSWKFEDTGVSLLVKYENNEIQRWDIPNDNVLDVTGDDWYNIYNELKETSGYFNPILDFSELKVNRKRNIVEVIHKSSGETIARLPKSLEMIIAHTSMPIWAGNHGFELIVFKLEGWNK